MLIAKEVMGILAISRPTLYRWVQEKKIPHANINGRIRFDKRDIERFIEQNTIK